MFAILFVAGDLQPRARADQARRGVARREGRRAQGGRHVRVDRREADHELGSGRRASSSTHKAGDQVQIVVDRGGEQHRQGRRRSRSTSSTVRSAVVAGISATVVTPQPVVRAGRSRWRRAAWSRSAHEAVDALGQIFSPSGMSKYFHVLAGTDKSKAANEQRFLSPVGFAQVASHAVDRGLGRGRRACCS